MVDQDDLLRRCRVVEELVLLAAPGDEQVEFLTREGWDHMELLKGYPNWSQDIIPVLNERGLLVARRDGGHRGCIGCPRHPRRRGGRRIQANPGHRGPDRQWDQGRHTVAEDPRSCQYGTLSLQCPGSDCAATTGRQLQHSSAQRPVGRGAAIRKRTHPAIGGVRKVVGQLLSRSTALAMAEVRSAKGIVHSTPPSPR